METWILVLVLSIGNSSSGPAMQVVPGYPTRAECAAAAESYNTQAEVPKGGRRAICIPGPRR